MGNDWFLKQFAQAAESGMVCGMTLNNGGMVITGAMISKREYFKSLGELVTHSSADAFGKAFGEEMVTEADGARDDDGDYIHLKNARFYAGPQPISKQGCLWRCKISSVDGFTFGEFE